MKKLLIKIFPEKKLIMTLPFLIGAALFIIFPMVLLIIDSTKSVEGVPSNAVVHDEKIWSIILRSVTLGLIASIFSLLIAFPYAWITARSHSKTFKVLAMSLIITPVLIFSVAKIFSLRMSLILFYQNINGQELQNRFIMIVGMIYMYMPFMVIPLYSVLKSMPNSLIEASNDLGDNNLKAIFKVILPYCLKAIFSGVAIVFMLSATSLVISNTLIKDDTKSFTMIGNKIDSYSAQIMIGEDAATKKGATLALITIVVVMSVYLTIYTFPIILKKIKGGTNV